MTFDQALRLLAALEREGVAYVMIGSMAMAANAVVRATRDIDLMVAANDDNIARLRRALRTLYDDPDIDQIRADDLAGDYPAVQYWPPGENYSIDIISRLGSAFVYDDVEWHWVDIEGHRVKVATPAMLYRMKRDTLRAQDHADAAALKRRFGLGD
ncbi:MAG: hypothetical protein KY460_08210 [Actinobacteria bacterium]|nr:hypothetical protein [Actinomycetota bacterium]